MNPTEIGRSYDAIAHVWQEPQIQSNGIRQFERALQFSTPRPTALDVGCGSSGRFMDLLGRHGFHVEGVDVSEQMIALARKRHPQGTFYHADIVAWPLPQKYDFIAAWDVIWHIPLEAQTTVMQKICAGLRPNGVLILTMGGLDRPEKKVDSAMGQPLAYNSLGVPQMLALLTSCGCICRHLEYDQHPEPHLYIIAQQSDAGAAHAV